MAGLDDRDDGDDVRAQGSPGRSMSTPCHPRPLTLHLTPAGEPTSPLLCLKKKQVPHQGATPVEVFKGDQDAGGNYEQEQWIEDTAPHDEHSCGAHLEADTNSRDRVERESNNDNGTHQDSNVNEGSDHSNRDGFQGYKNEGQHSNSDIDNPVASFIAGPVTNQPAVGRRAHL